MKLFKYTDQSPIYYYNTNQQVEVPDTYIEKPLRGMWVSNVGNIDLPVLQDIDQYKSQIIHMLETCILYNINTIFFQVRTTNDAFYLSELNPISRFFTGQEGKEPEADILPWIIEEAHARGIAFHAWCNPYRISFNGTLSITDYLATCDEKNLAKQHPEYIVLDTNGKLILNPAIQEVQDHIVASMVEIVSKYDVDGIHFDDYFYPYSGLDAIVNDDPQFKQQDLALGDFRRNNVNTCMKAVYDGIKAVDPSVQFGISPFGIWKNKKQDEYGSNTAPNCSESYYNQYADTLAWIDGEYIDYVVPQIYWEFGHKIAPFADICNFWVEAVQNKQVELYIGHGTYRYGSDGEFANPLEVVNQIKYANQFPEVQGNIFFTYNTFTNQNKSKQGMKEVRKLLNKE
jgi:uncharacterized lipoprotein YddW (UPF0748 family)